MQQVTLAEASEHLAQFIDAALKGEEIVILKDKQPVVKLTPIEPVKRRPAKASSGKGLIWMSDDFDSKSS
ncbi:type II toxin-antitoxin system Phd/YefM family antitoxin [Nostoc sp. CHAB 5784]|uniref:type II toxin-antitoxin system Phd/YefM family antitoxin n=1 Tax=Nostoc mirabile TaxID=2907820 RepID=UPI001E62BAD3|nr:type II toxin-antitoxin system Phd/YefM family antitoxin [Nostoc mirabile]MCC5667077.1 type II toxin-antitoxin system Phd/YefM family antitoxin [Nostoc mirabile CHAB5784]